MFVEAQCSQADSEHKDRQQNKLHILTDDGTKANFRNTRMSFPKYLFENVQNMSFINDVSFGILCLAN